MSERDVEDIINEIENYNKKKIDGKILACAMRLVYYAGLQRNEIPVLTIGDVYEPGGKIRDKISNFNIDISDRNIRIKLSDHYDYTKAKGCLMSQTDPFFHKYYSDGSDLDIVVKRIGDHLKRINSEYKSLIRDLRNQGMKYFYEKCTGTKESALEETADQFRVTERSVKDSINDKITPPGKQKPQGKHKVNMVSLKHSEGLLALDYSNIKQIKSAIDVCYNEIYTLSDTGLGKSEKHIKVGAFKNFIVTLLKDWKQ